MRTRWTSIYVVLVAFGLGFGVLPKAVAQTPDVNGIKLGMTLDEAKSRIGGGYETRMDKFADPALVLLSAATSHNVMVGDGWVIETVNGKVAYIERKRYFPTDAQPERSAVMKGLQEKYGGLPTDELDGSEWFYESGKLVSPGSSKPMVQKCHGIPDVQPTALYVTNNHGATGEPMDYMYSFRPGCPFHVRARLIGRELITGIVVTLVDEAALYNESALVARAKGTQKQQAIEKGKQAKTQF